ncbi:MAG: ThuA domain-containing protein [Gillisia sp.]
MKSLKILIAILFFNFSFIAAQEKNVLVFHKTEGFYHESIPKGIKTIQELGEKYKFKVEETKDSEYFTDDQLKKYSLVIFLNTTGNVLDLQQQNAFEGFINNGGSYFGIHAATDTEYDWAWYGKLAGAYFKSHPKITKAEITVKAPDHPTVAHLPETWTRVDEWYNFKNINPEITVLLNLEEHTYEGGENGKNHPIAWYQELDGGGKSVYTGGGHTEEAYDEPEFREHILRSILFALGEN